MRELIALSAGSLLSVLLAVAPLERSAFKPEIIKSVSVAADRYLQCYPYIVGELAPKRTFLHDCGGSVLSSRQDASSN
jgi:hypothetical protein